MRSQIAYINEQLASGLFPHAYLFFGNDESEKERAIALIARRLLGGNFTASYNFAALRGTREEHISIDMIRSLRSSLFLKPFIEENIASPVSIAVIYNIEYLSRDASPVLLKILEEPPKNCIFLATTARLDGVLPTLRSRFAKMRFWKKHDAANETFNSLSRKSLDERIASIRELIEKNQLELAMRDAISEKEEKLREKIYSGEQINITRNELERLTAAYNQLLFDPTIQKKILGEYAMFFI